MKYVLKYVFLHMVSLVVEAYTAFAAMCYWNWFATRALHVGPLYFLEALGLVWLIQLLHTLGKNEREGQWKILWGVLYRLVPDGKSEEARDAAMKDYFENDIWLDVAWKAVWQVLDNTKILAIGVVLHLFLLS